MYKNECLRFRFIWLSTGACLMLSNETLDWELFENKYVNLRQ